MVPTKQERKTNYTMTFVLRMRCWTIHTRCLLNDYGYGAYTTFHNISLMVSLLMEESEVPGEYHWPVASHCETWSHNAASSTPRHERSSNSQLKWSYALIAHVVVNLTTIRPRRPLVFILCQHFSTVADWVYP